VNGRGRLYKILIRSENNMNAHLVNLEETIQKRNQARSLQIIKLECIIK